MTLQILLHFIETIKRKTINSLLYVLILGITVPLMTLRTKIMIILTPDDDDTLDAVDATSDNADDADDI